MRVDRELLELAAEALDNPKIKWNGSIWCNCERMNSPDAHGNSYPGEWDPLTDDGDALRLSVKLDIYVMQVTEQGHVAARIRNGARTAFNEPIGSDPYAASRRAIVRAAAAIGRKEASNER